MGLRQGTGVSSGPRRLVAALIVVAIAAAVSGPLEAAAQRPDAASGQLTGTLGGDSSLEGGCAWLERPEGRYEVWWPEGYEIEFSPLRLIGPSGDVVAVEGDSVTVQGSRVRDAMTICQVGPVFDADAVLR